jgi:hypothetical protein
MSGAKRIVLIVVRGAFLRMLLAALRLVAISEGDHTGDQSLILDSSLVVVDTLTFVEGKQTERVKQLVYLKANSAKHTVVRANVKACLLRMICSRLHTHVYGSRFTRRNRRYTMCVHI